MVRPIRDEVDVVPCAPDTHEWYFASYCGCSVCDKCNAHAHLRRGTNEVDQWLARCYCGYNLAPGERLEDDVDDY
jgi:hypothetical protein